ncbi:MAG: hypothetical protein IPJ40_19625 [Saprospirales bacterium]|nr:hypothetical protein [Saprospirales bacterium]
MAQHPFSNQYSYHHGYYDHAEREFRGFGRVEQTDIEDFGTFADGNANSPYITQDKTLYQPPVKTITWMHTGAFMGKDRILNQFAKEYFRPNGNGFHENELPEPDLEAQGLSAAEYREALRACKGMPLRTETYELAVDDIGHVTEQRVKFFSAAFHNCHFSAYSPQKDNRYAVFLVTESEAVTYNYEPTYPCKRTRRRRGRSAHCPFYQPAQRRIRSAPANPRYSLPTLAGCDAQRPLIARWH